MLEIVDLNKKIDGLSIIKNLSLSIDRLGIVMLAGANGSGKTTLFDLISGYQKQDSGEIFFDGQGIQKLSVEERVKKGIVRTFQRPRIIPNMSTISHVIFSLTGHGHNPSFSFKKSLHNPELLESAKSLLETVDLLDYQNSEGHELSFGQKKRLNTICAIALQSSVILLDEPFSGVDENSKEILSCLITSMKNKHLFFIIEHDIYAISHEAHTMILLQNGRIEIQGTPNHVLNSDKFWSAFNVK